jgi:hypothetical protein
MTLSIEERKARREEGRVKEKQGLTRVEKIHRALVNGRPRASELKTPLAALMEARTLHRELESRMRMEGLDPKPGDCAVSIGFISTDLSVLGTTWPYTPEDESALMRQAEGHILLGLVFGLVNKEATDEKKQIVLGARPFLTAAQTDDWLKELFVTVRLAMEDARLDAKMRGKL